MTKLGGGLLTKEISELRLEDIESVESYFQGRIDQRQRKDWPSHTVEFWQTIVKVCAAAKENAGLNRIISTLSNVIVKLEKEKSDLQDALLDEEERGVVDADLARTENKRMRKILTEHINAGLVADRQVASLREEVGQLKTEVWRQATIANSLKGGQTVYDDVSKENERLKKINAELDRDIGIAQGNTDAAIDDYNDALKRIKELEEQLSTIIEGA